MSRAFVLTEVDWSTHEIDQPGQPKFRIIQDEFINKALDGITADQFPVALVRGEINGWLLMTTAKEVI